MTCKAMIILYRHGKVRKILHAVAAILDIGMERFWQFESLCYCDASHQVSAQSDLVFGRR